MNRQRNRLIAAGFAGALALVAGTGIAEAKDGDIRANGTCTAGSTSQIKLAPRPSDGVTTVEFEVDQNVVGATWQVSIADNGVVVVNRSATTVAPSGSFEVRTRRPGAAGHAIVATATNSATGETCSASASV